MTKWIQAWDKYTIVDDIAFSIEKEEDVKKKKQKIGEHR